MAILNVAFYKFVMLRDLPVLRAHLKNRGVELGLKGTVLLSLEGINGFLAGPEAATREMIAFLRGFPEFTDLQFKESFSDTVPFKRMLVKKKREIITMGRPDIRPAERRSPAIAPKELARRLAAGEDILLLDTRNTYEIEAGTFKNAVHLNLARFRDFPEKAASLLPPDYKTKPVVAFCTGGIRCEKAAPLLEQLGFKNVYQLEGGILKYFEETGGAHYEGECFVFDYREAVDAGLRPKSSKTTPSSLSWSERPGT